MQNYVAQLLRDLKALKEQVKPRIGVHQHFKQDEIEQALRIAPYKPLEDWIGIAKISFPSENRLSFPQAEALLLELQELLFLNGYRVNFPIDAPVNLRYQVLVEYLDKPTPRLDNYDWQLSICGYEPKKCKFGPLYCQCRAWENILNDLPKQNALVNSCKIVSFLGRNKKTNPFSKSNEH